MGEEYGGGEVGRQDAVQAAAGKRSVRENNRGEMKKRIQKMRGLFCGEVFYHVLTHHSV